MYRLTKLKQKPNPECDDTPIVPIGRSIKGDFYRRPTVGESFMFQGMTISDGIVTTTVKEIESEVEPGITYLTTRNSIYKLENLDDTGNL